LLINAVKYSPQGGRIEVSAAARSNGISIEIADQGIGIPADELTSIFEPFQRSRMVRGRIQGVGIGLSGARRIVEAHGGTIEVHSVVGAGTTFTIWLPRTAKSPCAPRSDDARERRRQRA
jgi:signal transduction histidine kinase